MRSSPTCPFPERACSFDFPVVVSYSSLPPLTRHRVRLCCCSDHASSFRVFPCACLLSATLPFLLLLL